MSYQRVLKRSWQILWGYKALWLFGFILALTTSSALIFSPADSNENNAIVIDLGDKEYFSATSVEEIEAEVQRLGRLIDDGLLVELREIFIAIGAVLIVVFFWIGAAALLRYVAETALIKMVYKHEESGKKVPIRQGFRLGWSRAAWRIFLIDLLVRFPVYTILLILFLLSLAPLLLWLTGSYAAGAVGIGLAVAMFVPLMFIAIGVGAAVTLFTQFFRRVCIVEDKGVLTSIGHGFAMVIENPKEILLTGLIVLGVGILFFIATIPLIILLLPVELLFILLGVLAAGFPVALIGGLGSIVFGGPIPWILAGAIGLPILMFFVAAPFALLRGLVEAYSSIIWTLTYRELKGLPVTLESKAPEITKEPKPAAA